VVDWVQKGFEEHHGTVRSGTMFLIHGRELPGAVSGAFEEEDDERRFKFWWAESSLLVRCGTRSVCLSPLDYPPYPQLSTLTVLPYAGRLAGPSRRVVSL